LPINAARSEVAHSRSIPREIRVTTLKDGDPEWELFIEGTIHRLAPGDRAQFCALLRSVQDEEMTHVEIRRGTGDAFSVHLNRERGFLMYLRQRNDGRCIFPVWDAQQPWAQEQFGCRCCEPWEIARHATLPRQIALSLLMDFFERGVPPALGEEVPVGWSERTLFPAGAIRRPNPPLWSDCLA
jgi:hypothetical protein